MSIQISHFSWWKEIKHFTPEEFACPCCGKCEMEQEFVKKLDELRDWIGEPLNITSGFRCVKHNKKVGGSENSAHLKGLAADIYIPNSTFRYKIIAFALSAAIGALAGAFYARWFRFIHPDMFKFWESILILCLIVFGGMGSITGALLGALILIPLTEVLRIVLPAELSNARYLLFGLIIVCMMRWRPAGLLPVEKE